MKNDLTLGTQERRLFSEFAKKYPRIHISAGQSLLLQEEETDHIYVVLDGNLKVFDVSLDGHEQLIWITRILDVVPIEAVTQLRTASEYFYYGYTDCTLCKIPVKDFRDFIKDRPNLLLVIIDSLVIKQHQLMRHLNALKKPTARQKILYILGFLSERFGDQERIFSDLVIPVSHQDIADMTGLSRKTVSIQLKEMSDENIVSYDATHFTIHTRTLSKFQN